jgi:hypothetical protein
MICFVTRYDPASRRPIGEPEVIEAETKPQAAEQAWVAPLSLPDQAMQS